jgi:hypothetical protein
MSSRDKDSVEIVFNSRAAAYMTSTVMGCSQRGINSCQICRTNHDNRVLAALISSSFPGVPSTFQ